MTTDGHEERQMPTLGDLFIRTIELGLGAATLTVEAAQRTVNELVKRGQMTKEEGSGFVDKLIATGHQQRAQIAEMIDGAVEQAMIRMDLARRRDLEAMRLRVAELERAVLGQPIAEEPISPIRESEMDDIE